MRCVVLIALLLVSCPSWGAEQPKTPALPPADSVAEFLQEISVTLKCNDGQGSGTMVVVPVNGKDRTFIWTAYHVIADLRAVKEVITPDGTKRQAVTFHEPEIVQEEIEDGARVGERKMLTRVVTCSEKEDLALLEVRKQGFARASAVFYLDKAVPKVGSDLWACGSPGGQEIGANSVTTGVISQIGRRFPEYPGEFDQVSCQGLPGSSGCGVYLRDGRFIGMLTMGIRGSDSFHYIVPLRRIKAWAEKMHVGWALGIGLPPTQADLDKIPIEDSGTMFKSTSAKTHGGTVPAVKFCIEREPLR